MSIIKELSEYDIGTYPRWIRLEFYSATNYETKKLIDKYENEGVYKFISKRTFFPIVSEEGRNIKFLLWLCDKISKEAGYKHNALLVYDDNTAGVYIEEDTKAKEEYFKTLYKEEEYKESQNELTSKDLYSNESDKGKQNNHAWVLIELNNSCIENDIYINEVSEMYYDILTENVYLKSIHSDGLVPYMYGNYPMRYNKEKKVLFYVDNNCHAHIISDNSIKEYYWE